MGAPPLGIYFFRARGLELGSREDEELEGLVVRAAAGDADAWQRLWSALEPRLAALLRKRSLGIPAGAREDQLRDVRVAIMARLRDDDFHRLNLFLEARRQDPELDFMRWLIVVARRVAIDAMRAHPDYVDRRRSAPAGESPGIWVQSEELRSALGGARPPITDRVAARQILRYADGVLAPPQRRALEMWADGQGVEDIAAALSLAGGADEAEDMIRAAVARLRRRFRKK